MYAAYLSQSDIKEQTYAAWAREWTLQHESGKMDDLQVRRRNIAGRGKGKRCAVAMIFPFELLDIFIGAFALEHLSMPMVPSQQHLATIVETSSNRFQEDFGLPCARSTSE